MTLLLLYGEPSLPTDRYRCPFVNHAGNANSPSKPCVCPRFRVSVQNLTIIFGFFHDAPSLHGLWSMLSGMSYYNRRNCLDVIDNPINRWPQDEIDILDGNCSFNVYYLGCVEVFEPTDSKTCRESFVKLYENYSTEICSFDPAVFWITGYELRIVDKKSKNLILAQTIENVLFCASVKDNPDQVYYTCRDVYSDRWLCHLFIVKNYSSDRLCRAVGFSFRVCMKRKTVREGLSSNTMKSTRSIG